MAEAGDTQQRVEVQVLRREVDGLTSQFSAIQDALHKLPDITARLETLAGMHEEIRDTFDRMDGRISAVGSELREHKASQARDDVKIEGRMSRYDLGFRIIVTLCTVFAVAVMTGVIHVAQKMAALEVDKDYASRQMSQVREENAELKSRLYRIESRRMGVPE